MLSRWDSKASLSRGSLVMESISMALVGLEREGGGVGSRVSMSASR